MCGRYTLANPDPARLRLRFDLDERFEIAEEPRFNIAPTDPVLAIRSQTDGAIDPGGAGREIGNLRWGLIPGHWATKSKGGPLINARAETIASQPAFAESFRERRCLIPADGFYEWLRDERGKTPMWFSARDSEPFAFAGIWARYEPREGEPVTSCAIVTCAPNALLAPIHDRMPLILGRDREAAWLDPEAGGEELSELLTPPPTESLVAREVSDLVNNVREDGPSLIEPRVEEPTLF